MSTDLVQRCMKWVQARGSRVKAMLAHPGASFTNLQLTTAGSRGYSTWMLNSVLSLFMMTAEDGSVPMLKCMTEPNLESGAFYAPRWIMIGDAVRIQPEKQLCGTKHAEESKRILWEESCKAVGDFVL